MKRTILLVVCALVIPQMVQAKSADTIRGGFGFLYPDFNLQNNPGQLVAGRGSAFEVGYSRQDASGVTNQGLTPSLAYSNGKVGIGVFGSRTGTGFGTDASTDEVGGSLGVALGKGKFNIGAQYSTSLEDTATDSGEIMGTINMNPGKGQGIALGIGVGTVLGSSTGSAVGGKAAIGYSGKNRNNNIEVVYTLPDIEDMDNYAIGVYGSLGDKSYYLGTGYERVTLLGTTTSDLLARAGIVLSGGRSTGFDISAMIRYNIDGNNDPQFGGTARISF